jgi:hypothetical protein
MRDEKIEQVYESLLNDWYPVEEQEEECPEGEQWCPIQKKCVPIGSGDGKGPRRMREDEEIEEASKIEGNWKPIVQAFHSIFDGFDRLGTLGALADRKYGKKLRDIEDKLVTLTNLMDQEFGGGNSLDDIR